MHSEPELQSRLGSELFTDLYELTMLRAYFELGMDGEAVFSLFVRKLPKERNLLIACGIDNALDALEHTRFRKDSLDYLASLGDRFPDPFLKWLEGFRFRGDVHAVSEGRPVFAGEPVLEVVAPITQAQLFETLLMNQVALQTVMASKAYRVVAAARGRPVVDFGSRRAQGRDAAVDGARAFAIAGVAATSNVLAGQTHGIPVTGTVAHSFIEAFDDEEDAFHAFAKVFPGTTLLVDTYDTLEGVRRVVRLKQALGEAFRVGAVRLDSGDLADLARRSRAILDEGGLTDVEIFASGGLDERRIAELLDAGAPVDGFGVGTDMSVSADAPSVDLVYKLTAYGGEGRMKLSTGKRTLPGRKQVFRHHRDGLAVGDTIARAGETLDGEPLLGLVMQDGRRMNRPSRSLIDIRDDTTSQIARLPEPVRDLDPADPPYPVRISDTLAAYEQEVRETVMRRAAGRVPA